MLTDETLRKRKTRRKEHKDKVQLTRELRQAEIVERSINDDEYSFLLALVKIHKRGWKFFNHKNWFVCDHPLPDGPESYGTMSSVWTSCY